MPWSWSCRLSGRSFCSSPVRPASCCRTANFVAFLEDIRSQSFLSLNPSLLFPSLLQSILLAFCPHPAPQNYLPVQLFLHSSLWATLLVMLDLTRPELCSFFIFASPVGKSCLISFHWAEQNIWRCDSPEGDIPETTKASIAISCCVSFNNLKWVRVSFWHEGCKLRAWGFSDLGTWKY